MQKLPWENLHAALGIGAGLAVILLLAFGHFAWLGDFSATGFWQFLFRFLTLSPFDSTPQEREIAVYLLMSTVIWAIPLVFDDVLALWRERTPYWRPSTSWRPVPRVAFEALAVGGFFTLILVLRSRVSLDFIYFQF